MTPIQSVSSSATMERDELPRIPQKGEGDAGRVGLGNVQDRLDRTLSGH